MFYQIWVYLNELYFFLTLIICLECQKTEDQKYNESKLIDNLYVKDLLEAYSKESDLIIL